MKKDQKIRTLEQYQKEYDERFQKLKFGLKQYDESVSIKTHGHNETHVSGKVRGEEFSIKRETTEPNKIFLKRVKMTVMEIISKDEINKNGYFIENISSDKKVEETKLSLETSEKIKFLTDGFMKGEVSTVVFTNNIVNIIKSAKGIVIPKTNNKEETLAYLVKNVVDYKISTENYHFIFSSLLGQHLIPERFDLEKEERGKLKERGFLDEEYKGRTPFRALSVNDINSELLNYNKLCDERGMCEESDLYKKAIEITISYLRLTTKEQAWVSKEDWKSYLSELFYQMRENEYFLSSFLSTFDEITKDKYKSTSLYEQLKGGFKDFVEREMEEVIDSYTGVMDRERVIMKLEYIEQTTGKKIDRKSGFSIKPVFLKNGKLTYDVKYQFEGEKERNIIKIFKTVKNLKMENYKNAGFKLEDQKKEAMLVSNLGYEGTQRIVSENSKIDVLILSMDQLIQVDGNEQDPMKHHGVLDRTEVGKKNLSNSLKTNNFTDKDVDQLEVLKNRIIKFEKTGLTNNKRELTNYYASFKKEGTLEKMFSILESKSESCPYNLAVIKEEKRRLTAEMGIMKSDKKVKKNTGPRI